MKRILALFLALSLILALAACGGKDVSGTVTPVEKTDDAPKGTVEPAVETPAETSPAEVVVEAGGDTAGEVPEETADEAAGMRYENENLGVGVLLDEDWVIYNEDQLAQLSGLTADMFSDEKYTEMMENSRSFYDFCAAHSSGASINVIFENLGLVYGSVMTEEQYRTAAMQGMPDAYASAGFENVKVEPNTIEFAGTERIGIHTSCVVNGVNYYVQQVLIKTGNHMGIISLCCFVQDDTPLMATFFYPLG